MIRNRVILSLVALPLLVLLVACGGDKKESSSSNDSGSSTSSNASSGSGSNNGGSVSSNDGGFSLDNCKQYASLQAQATAAFGTSTNFKIDKKALDDLVKGSPSEIRGDMQLVVNTIVDVFTGFEKLGVNFNDPSSFARMDAAKLAEMEKLGEKFDDQKFTAASERIEKYFVSKCS